jgi:hypothetical protein
VEIVWLPKAEEELLKALPKFSRPFFPTQSKQQSTVHQPLSVSMGPKFARP